MCSATLSELEETIISKILSIRKKEWKQYKHVDEFRTGKPVKASHSTSYEPDSTKLKLTLIEQVRNNSNTPFLVFSEDYDFAIKLFDGLEKQLGVKLHAIPDGDTLERTNIEAVNCQNGVFVMPTLFGRGIDFKLLKEAKVVILMGGSLDLNSSDID